MREYQSENKARQHRNVEALTAGHNQSFDEGFPKTRK
jgi:hypothetical protein